MRIGLLLGTFDPPHIGHALNAVNALNNKVVDMVYIVPTTQNPTKAIGPIATFEQRVQMCNLLAEDLQEVTNNKVYVNPIEQYLPPNHFTWDVLEALQEQNPADTFTILCGEDIDVSTWYNGEAILNKYSVVTIPRSAINISSTKLRQMLSAKMYTYPFLTKNIIQYIGNIYD